MGKLTISMNDQTIVAAKQLAAEDSVTLSAMFTRYVLSRLEVKDLPSEVAPVTKRLSGIISLEDEGDQAYRDKAADAMMEKYGL